MSYTINWELARKDLCQLEKQIAQRIIKKVGSLVEDPFHFVEHLEGYPLWKIRIGDYRAILDIKQKEAEIVVLLVDHRKRIYTRLD